MKLDIQLFGGRGASSSNKNKSVYNNRYIDSFSDWYDDNLDWLADRFEEKYNKPPVNNYGMTNSKWDPFVRSEYKKEEKAVKEEKEKKKKKK